MICNTCGRPINNEEANFCEYCGASQRNRIPEVEKNDNPVVEPAKYTNAILFGDWILSMAIIFVVPMFIPIFGHGVSAFLLIYWGFINKQVNESKRNWSRAMLIFGPILIIYRLVSTGNAIVMSGNPEFIDLMKSIMNQ